MATVRGEHGDRKGRHYYTTFAARFPCIVVATLAVAMPLRLARLFNLYI